MKKCIGCVRGRYCYGTGSSNSDYCESNIYDVKEIYIVTIKVREMNKSNWCNKRRSANTNVNNTCGCAQ